MQSDIALVMQVETINLDTVSKLQKYVDPGEVISLVFLLDDCPKRALKNLITYQRMSEIGGKPPDVLLDWAIEAASKRDFWKWKFLDALHTCQLFSVIRNIHIDNVALNQHLLSLPQQSYVNPLKKQIYKICENMRNICYLTLKQKLVVDYSVILDDYENCEILFLQLMCKDFFSISLDPNLRIRVDKLVNVLDQIQELRDVTSELKYLAVLMNINRLKVQNTSFDSTQGTSGKETENAKETNKNRKLHLEDFDESFLLLNQLTLEEINFLID